MIHWCRAVAIVGFTWLVLFQQLLIAEDSGGKSDEIKYPTEMASFELTVLAEGGDPIADASIDLGGMRSAEDSGSWYFWPTYNTGKIGTIKTDANGKATIPYPVKFGHPPDWNTASEVTATITHPDYISKELAADPSSGKAEVTLRSGCRLTLSAVDSANERVPFGLMIAGPGRSAKWADGEDGARYSQAIPDGTWQSMLVSPWADGRHLFSPLISIRLRDGQSVGIRNIKSKPGVRLQGVLDNSVPHPVTGGKVIVHCLPKPDGRTYAKDSTASLAWRTSAEIAEDGTFEIPSIPRRGLVQIITICNGYTRKNENVPKRNFAFRQGLFIELGENDVQSATIPMEKTASVKVRVLKPDGTPLPNAWTTVCPNQHFHLSGASIVGSIWESINEIKHQLDPEFEMPSHEDEKSRYLQVRTNEQGIAMINDIPDHGRESVSAGHEDYIMPFAKDGAAREKVVMITGGEVTEVEIKMLEKKCE